MAEVNNEDLIRNITALKNGDSLAFAQIYHCFGPRLYAFTKKLLPYPEDVAEIVQQVFVKLWERKHFLDPHQNFDGYLFRMARNLVYNRARQRVYAFTYYRYLSANENQTENQTQDSMDYQELQQLLEETYAAFPPVRRQVFMMSRMEGRSNGEIAQILHTSNSNIENHINKALREIRIKLRHYKIFSCLFIGALFS